MSSGITDGWFTNLSVCERYSRRSEGIRSYHKLWNNSELKAEVI